MFPSTTAQHEPPSVVIALQAVETKMVVCVLFGYITPHDRDEATFNHVEPICQDLIQLPDWQNVINDLHNPAHALILSTKKSIKACHLMLMGQSSQFHGHLRFQDIGLARGLG